MTDLKQRLLVDAVAGLRLGSCDDAVPLQGLQGRVWGCRAVTGLHDLWGSRFGLEHVDDIFSGLQQHRQYKLK